MLLASPFGEIFDLIACWQIAHGAKEKIVYEDIGEAFDAMIPENLV